MVELAELIGRETGVEFRVVGFDTGEGLPAPRGYKDHPEIWSDGDFPMPDRDALIQKLRGRAEIILGNIDETIGGFARSLQPSAPLSFISVDVDVYTGARSSLKGILGDAELYAPAVSCYLDDVSFFFANKWCGELAAIHEFNRENEHRKIDRDRSLTPRMVSDGAAWCAHMYVCHILDHPARNHARDRTHLNIASHHEFMKSHFLY